MERYADDERRSNATQISPSLRVAAVEMARLPAVGRLQRRSLGSRAFSASSCFVSTRLVVASCRRPTGARNAARGGY